MDAVRAGGDRDAAGHRLSDHLRGRPLAAGARPALPRRGRLRRPGQLRHRAQRAAVVGDGLQHGLHRGGLGRDRARARHGHRAGHAPGAVLPRPRAHHGAHPVRDHHRRRGVRLVLRVRPGQRLRQPAAVRARRQGLVRRPLERARGDHRRRGLEDDAVHGAAAARRPDDDRRRASTRPRTSTGRAPGSASGGSRCR